MSSQQWHFEFKDWEEAFKFFYRKRCGEELIDGDGRRLGFREGNPKLVFVVSTAFHVSGYWIEEDAVNNADTRVYRTVSAVRQLERRIRRERSKTVNLSLGRVIV